MLLTLYFKMPSIAQNQSQDPYGVETKYLILSSSVPIMLEAFKNGTRFTLKRSLSIEAVPDIQMSCRAKGTYQEIHVKVTNDERRRLIPLLKRFMSSQTHNQ